MSSVGNISRLVPGLVEKPGTNPIDKGIAEIKNGGNFNDIFSEMINSVDGLQIEAAQIQEAFMNGEPVELHQVMIKAQEAGISMDLLLEIRNKLLNAYNEIMRMPM